MIRLLMMQRKIHWGWDSFRGAPGVLCVPFLVFLPAIGLAAESTTSAAEGMAGAGVARPWGAGARSTAAMSLLPGYAAHGDLALDGSGARVGGVVMETRVETPLGVWASWTRDSGEASPSGLLMPGWVVPGEDEVENFVVDSTAALGLGGAVLEQRLALGFSGSYQKVESELSGVEKAFDMNVSAAARLGDGLTLTAVGRSLLPTGEEDPWGEVGTWWEASKVLGLGLDGTWKDDWYGFRAGVEGRVGGELALRGGYGIHGGEHRAGAGLGVMNESGRLDYAFSVVPTGSEAGAMFHSLGVTLNLATLR